MFSYQTLVSKVLLELYDYCAETQVTLHIGTTGLGVCLAPVQIRSSNPEQANL
jgi:hypothetical protein